MWSRSYLHFGLFHLLANASSKKMADDFVKKYTARINEETVQAPNGNVYCGQGVPVREERSVYMGKYMGNFCVVTDTSGRRFVSIV